MCFGGGGDDSSSRELIAMQKEEAAEARRKEEARQGRIKGGLERIRQAFEGAPVMATRTGQFDWGKFAPPTTQGNVSQLVKSLSADPATMDRLLATKGVGAPVGGLPAGYTYVKAPARGGVAAAPTAAPTAVPRQGITAVTPAGITPAAATPRQAVSFADLNRRGGGGQSLKDRSSSTAGGVPSGGKGAGAIQGKVQPEVRLPQSSGGKGAGAIQGAIGPTPAGGGGMVVPNDVWAIRGPDGKLYYPGDVIPTSEQYATGKTTGGFDPNFYNQFRQSILDYYMPQVQEKFGEAAKETMFRHARAGTLESSGKIGTAADLVKQNLLQQGKVQSQADTAATELKNRVAKERAAAEAQLYATENPDVAANQALAAVENIAATEPETTPLGDIFNIATIGGIRAYQGLQNARRLGGYAPGGYGATRTVG
jgi:hypothetical protein